MSDKTPDFMVRGEAYKDDIAIPVTIMGNYPTNQTDPVECFVLADNPDEIQKAIVYDDKEGDYLQLRATKTSPHLDGSWAQHIDDIWIPKLWIENRETKGRKFFDNSIRGIAELFVQGCVNDDKYHNADFHGYVLLQKTPLLGRSRIEGEATWDTPFGSATLIRDLKREDEVKGRIYEWEYPNQDLIELKLNSTHFSSDRDMVLGIVDYLDELMWLISFLSKKYIWWYRIDIDGPIKVYGNPRMVKHSRKGRNDVHPNDLLIDLNTFHSGESQTLFDNFQNSPNKDKILPLIHTLMSTYVGSFFEHDLAMAHITLEKLVHNFSEKEYIIENNRFKKLKKSLKKTLNEAAQNESEETNLINPEELAQIKIKLSELQRCAYKERLKALFKDIFNEISDCLESRSTPMELLDKIDGLANRRNEFIHQGNAEDIDKAYRDICFIRFMVGLWILKLLDYPLDKINPLDHDLFGSTTK